MVSHPFTQDKLKVKVSVSNSHYRPKEIPERSNVETEEQKFKSVYQDSKP